MTIRSIFIVVIILFVLLGAYQFASARGPSAYDFMKPSENKEMVISPSGKKIAFVQSRTNDFCTDPKGFIKPDKEKCNERWQVLGTTNSILVYDLETGNSVRTIAIPENYYVEWLEFGSEEKIIAAITYRTVANRSYASRVVSFSALPLNEDDSSAVILFQNEGGVNRRNRWLSEVSNFLRSEPDYIVMPAMQGTVLDLWKVNIVDGTADRIGEGKPGTFFWYTDKNGNPILRYDCIASNCYKILVYAPSKKGDDWEKIKEFKTKPDEELEDFDFYPVAMTDIENQFYVISDEETDARRSVKIFDIETKSYVRKVYEHPKMDVSGVVLDLDTGGYLGVRVIEDRIRYYLEDPTLQSHFDHLDQQFEEKSNVRLVGFDEKRKKAIVYVSAYNIPGVYHIYDFQTKEAKKLIGTEPNLEIGIESEGRILDIETRDGSTITAYHYYPKMTPTGAPLLVMPHGGPNVRDTFDFSYWSQYFVSLGYQVVRMNFRGSSGYGREFEESGYGEWGGLMQDDVSDTVKYFHDNGIASPEKTCIVGYSYGGYAALYGGATTPELYKCIVSGGGVADLVRSMKDDKENLNKNGFEFMKESMGDLKTDKKMLVSKSPVNLADKFQQPVLLIHGTADKVVEYHHSEKMEKALKKAGKDVIFHELEREGHGEWGLSSEIFYLETVADFLNQHIGPE